MSQGSSSGSSSYDCGDRDPFEVLEELQQKALESVKEQKLALQTEMRTTRNEINELKCSMTRGDQLPPVPEESEETGGREMPVPDVAECMSLEMAHLCKLESNLRAAVMTAKIREQQAQSLLSSAAKVSEICDALAKLIEDSDDQEEPADTQAPADPTAGTHEPHGQGDTMEPDE